MFFHQILWHIIEDYMFCAMAIYYEGYKGYALRFDNTIVKYIFNIEYRLQLPPLPLYCHACKKRLHSGTGRKAFYVSSKKKYSSLRSIPYKYNFVDICMYCDGIIKCRENKFLEDYLEYRREEPLGEIPLTKL